MNEDHIAMLVTIADRMRVSEPHGCIAQLHIRRDDGFGGPMFHVEVGSPSGQSCGASDPDLCRAIRAIYRLYVLRMSCADEALTEPRSDPREHPVTPSQEQEDP